MKRFKATGTTADKTISCRRKSVCVKRVVEAVTRRGSLGIPDGRVSVPSLSRLSPAKSQARHRGRGRKYWSLCMWLWLEYISTYTWKFWRRYVLPFFNETFFFRWVDLYGALCNACSLRTSVFSLVIWMWTCSAKYYSFLLWHSGPSNANRDQPGSNEVIELPWLSMTFLVVVLSKVIWGADIESDIYVALICVELRSWYHLVIRGQNLI